MIVFDFVFYYLTYWFTKNKEKLSWSTPPERTAYAMGLMVVDIVFSISILFEHYNLSIQFSISKLYFLIIGLAVMQFFQFIYIKRNRYEKISKKIPEYFSISDDTGANISIAIASLLIMSPFIILIIFSF